MAQLIPLQTHLSNLRWLRWIPVFRSSVLFNGVNYQGDGVNYQGDNCKSKKEAEQLVACAVILSCLDSKSGNDIEINSVHKGTNVVVPLTEAQIAATTPALPVGTNIVVPLTEAQIAVTILALPFVIHNRESAFFLPTPKGKSRGNYARCVNQILQNLNNMQLSDYDSLADSLRLMMP
ncbi:hypothetical protein Tco_0916266 [Tanacetum coccineum]